MDLATGIDSNPLARGAPARRARAWLTMGVGRRLAAGFGIVVLLAAASGLVSMAMMRSLDRGLSEIVETRYARTELVRGLIDEVNEIASASRDALLLHPEVDRPVDDELIEFLERAGIEKERDPLARGQLPLVVLPVDASGAAAKLTLALPPLQLFELRLE